MYRKPERRDPVLAAKLEQAESAYLEVLQTQTIEEGKIPENVPSKKTKFEEHFKESKDMLNYRKDQSNQSRKRRKPEQAEAEEEKEASVPEDEPDEESIASQVRSRRAIRKPK